MANVIARVIGPSGTSAAGVTLTLTLSGASTASYSTWPAKFSVPDNGFITLQTSGGNFSPDSVVISLNKGAPPTWTNPNTTVQMAGNDLTITLSVFSIREVPLKVVAPTDIVSSDYPAPFSLNMPMKDRAKTEAENNRLIRDLTTRYTGVAVVLDAGGGRPQYRGFDDFPKSRTVCMDPETNTQEVLKSSSATGWDRVRHTAETVIDPAYSGITYVVSWTRGNIPLLVGIYVPKAKKSIARSRNYVVFYTSNTAKPEFQTDYPFGWLWFPAPGLTKVNLVQPFFDLIGRYLFQAHFLAIQSLCASRSESPPVVIVPVWPKSDASVTSLISIDGLVDLVYEVACFVHRRGLDDPATAPEWDSRSTFARSGITEVFRIQVPRPEVSIAVACHSAGVDNALTLAKSSPGSMAVGAHSVWKYLWLLDPVWRGNTAQDVSVWMGRRSDRKALIVRSEYVLKNPGSLAPDVAATFGIHPSVLPDAGGGTALEGHTPDDRFSVLQASQQFLSEPHVLSLPYTGNIPMWGTPNNDQHQFVPNFGLGLAVRLARL